MKENHSFQSAPQLRQLDSCLASLIDVGDSLLHVLLRAVQLPDYFETVYIGREWHVDIHMECAASMGVY